MGRWFQRLWLDCAWHLLFICGMNKHISDEFDPFRVVMSFASEAGSADLVIETFTGAGLTFDVGLSGKDDFSHTCRIRALLPRVFTAYDCLSPEAKLAAANAATGKFLTRIQQLQMVPKYKGIPEQMVLQLEKIGWGFQDNGLVALDPKVREMFFPKNSQWDAFVAIRQVIDTAQNDLMIVDPFCDRAFFGILESSTARPKVVRLLCRNNPAALQAEAKAFASQRQIGIELRKSSDFHDRFLVVDQATCVHIGASINQAGSRAFMISAVEDAGNREALIQALNEAWNTGVQVPLQ